MKAYLLTLAFSLLTALATFAQSSSGVEMATGLRSSGKIWVVVLVLLTLIIGLFLYLYSIDRKIKKIENKNK